MAGASTWLNERIGQLKIAAARIAASSPTTTEQPSASPPIKWVGDKVEIVQLGYALIAAGKVKGMSDKKFIQALGAFFGSELTAPANARNNFKGNRNKKGTLIDKLKDALDDYLND